VKQQGTELAEFRTATTEWAALRDDGLTFVSDPASTSITEFALLVKERNGVFFS
jgi:hypothetical protein